ncbi:MAG TPA: trehalose-6-phosphate synthase, partial [Rhodospirillales bacterium]|nr:trehalose-6-phosphate synthase [Rhodospirillales bacterium]
ILTALPGHESLVRSLCAYDVVGFQTENDLRAFLDYIVNEAGGGIMGNHLIHAFGRTLGVEIFPIGIDTEDFVRAGQKENQSASVKILRGRPEGFSWIIGVDRLDYSKGLVERFQSFSRLLESHPTYRGQIALLQIAPPSRSEVPEYREIRRTLEAESGHINGRFAEFDWVPINYLNKSYTRQDLAGFYQASRIGLVTPLRDGMNLVAKEYVASQNPEDPGVLVLSRFAGAARELESALIVNPFDYEGVADAIAKGLEMPLEERRSRWAAMMENLRANTLTTWRDKFLNTLSKAPYET